MKKNLKIVSLAAAALLAVAPVVASTTTANAAITLGSPTSNQGTPSTPTTTTAPTDRAYWALNNQIIGAENKSDPTANVVQTNDISISVGDKVSDIAKEINKLPLVFYSSVNAKPESLNIKDPDLATMLSRAGVTFTDNTNTTIKSVPSSAFNLTLTGVGSNANQTATIQLPINVSSQSTSDTDVPVIHWSEGTKEQPDSLTGHIFKVTVGSQFNPTNFTTSDGTQITIFANQTATNSTAAQVTAPSNVVDTSAAGHFYDVTVTATGINGKKTTATYIVLITSSHKQTLYANGADAIPTYRIYGSNVLNNGKTYKDGDKVYVADGTKTVNKISYSQISDKSKKAAAHSNVWVQTSALAKANTPEVGQVKMVMHDSEAYDANGKALGHVYANYTNITIIPEVKTINGKTYYKVANKDEYVRVTNITGTARVLRHNAYVYRSSYRRADSRKLYKGSTVITYGGSYRFRNGKRYWRIGGPSKQYVKCANF